MSWSDCGTDSDGRPIGYGFEATCDHPGCNKKIDRGLAYACGGMHGNETWPVTSVRSCEGYFCYDHRTMVWPDGEDGDGILVCLACAKEIEERVDDPPQR